MRMPVSLRVRLLSAINRQTTPPAATVQMVVAATISMIAPAITLAEAAAQAASRHVRAVHALGPPVHRAAAASEHQKPLLHSLRCHRGSATPHPTLMATQHLLPPPGAPPLVDLPMPPHAPAPTQLLLLLLPPRRHPPAPAPPPVPPLLPRPPTSSPCRPSSKRARSSSNSNQS